jgi:hypothetical protein
MPVVLHDSHDTVVQEEGQRQHSAQGWEAGSHERNVQRRTGILKLDIPAPLTGFGHDERDDVKNGQCTCNQIFQQFLFSSQIKRKTLILPRALNLVKNVADLRHMSGRRITAR